MIFRGRFVSALVACLVALAPLSAWSEELESPAKTARALSQIDMVEVAKRAIEEAQRNTSPPPSAGVDATGQPEAASALHSKAQSPLASQPKFTKPTLVAAAQIDRGDTAWMLAATVFVFLMTVPGLALFYGGMVRKKNVLGTMSQSFAAMAVVSLVWVAVGHTIAFGTGNAWFGDASRLFLRGMLTLRDGSTTVHPLAPTIPESVFVLYEMMFAVVATALVAGAFAERVKFSATLLFCALWPVLVYAPIAHMAWMPNGLFTELGVLDYAGGNVVHVTAGFAGLLAAFWIGPRRGYGEEIMAPHHLGFTLLGGAMLWVGWFGFNAGSALAADGRAALAMMVTHIAAVSGALTWAVVEFVMRNRVSSLGIISGALAGLVAITPASGYVGPAQAFVFGIVAAFGGYFGATTLKRMVQCDDSLDVFGIHGICGLIGGLLTGLLASTSLAGAAPKIGMQLLACTITILYTWLATSVILIVINALVKLRMSPLEEGYGLDMTQHGEIVE
jgi:Amt family ammonium transporter